MIANPIRAIREFLAWYREVSELARNDDALYAADTELLERIRAQRQTTTGAPAPGAETAAAGTARRGAIRSDLPELPNWVRRPAADPDYSSHQWPAAYHADAVAHWMIERYPDAWYFEAPEIIWPVAERLLAVRLQAVLGMRSS